MQHQMGDRVPFFAVSCFKQERKKMLEFEKFGRKKFLLNLAFLERKKEKKQY